MLKKNVPKVYNGEILCPHQINKLVLAIFSSNIAILVITKDSPQVQNHYAGPSIFLLSVIAQQSKQAENNIFMHDILTH